jgi:hypothetical protein
MSPMSFLVYAPHPVIRLEYVNLLTSSTVDYMPFTDTVSGAYNWL